MVEKSTAEESNPAVIGVLFLFFAPCSAIFGTLCLGHGRGAAVVAFQLLAFSRPWKPLFAHSHVVWFPPRGKRSAVDSLLFCASSFLSIYGSFLLFLFLFFSVPVLLSQSCLLCFFLSLSLYSGVLPPPPLLSPYSQSFRPYCKLALMASSCSSLSRL